MLVGSQSIFEEVAWDLVADAEMELETARSGLASYRELEVVGHRLNYLKGLAGLGL